MQDTFLEMLRAVIYTRVSQDRNGIGRSVTDQERECRVVCEREGWQVISVFCDNDRSASRYATKSRPEFAQVLDLIDSGGYDVLVTWEASRATRDLKVYTQLAERCAIAGVLWCYSGSTHDLRTRDGQIQDRSGCFAFG
jgi:site-specific DNA recombinase